MSSPTSTPYGEQNPNLPEQDEIQEDTTSMEEKLEELQPDDARDDALSDAEGRN